MMTVAEECLEMTGIVLFIHALTSYMSLYVKDVQIRFNGKAVEDVMTGSASGREILSRDKAA